VGGVGGVSIHVLRIAFYFTQSREGGKTILVRELLLFPIITLCGGRSRKGMLRIRQWGCGGVSIYVLRIAFYFTQSREGGKTILVRELLLFPIITLCGGQSRIGMLRIRQWAEGAFQFMLFGLRFISLKRHSPISMFK